MKKGRIIGLVLVFLVLVVPIPSGVYKDGGTRTYSALTYKVVKWKHLIGDGVYEKTRVYFLLDAYKSLDALWEMEEPYVEQSFVGEIKDIDYKSKNVTVEPMEWEMERNSCEQIVFQNKAMEDGEFDIGELVKVTYKGGIMETYPAKVNAIGMEIATELRYMNYEDTWIAEGEGAQYEGIKDGDLVIRKIYANCFFATPVLPSPVEYKLNGTISDEWCVGDKVHVSFINARYDEKTNRMEADFHKIEVSTFEPEPGMSYKPVIYLYPEKEMEVTVKMDLDGAFTCTYPTYKNGWSVKAAPDGTLTDAGGQTYNYLYWEGVTNAQYDFTKGFCVRGEDTAQFLEGALEKLGLTRKEANEFIVYWLPIMQEHTYNIISFQTERYTDAAQLSIKPNPDTVIRVFMAFKESEQYVEMQQQELSAPDRKGFTVVEWGGTFIEE